VVKGGSSLSSDQTIHSQDNIHHLSVFWELGTVCCCVRVLLSDQFLLPSVWLVFLCCLRQCTTMEYQVLNLSLLDVGRLLALKHGLHLYASCSSSSNQKPNRRASSSPAQYRVGYFLRLQPLKKGCFLAKLASCPSMYRTSSFGWKHHSIECADGLHQHRKPPYPQRHKPKKTFFNFQQRSDAGKPSAIFSTWCTRPLGPRPPRQ
jgi:hypothetical protein